MPLESDVVGLTFVRLVCLFSFYFGIPWLSSRHRGGRTRLFGANLNSEPSRVDGGGAAAVAGSALDGLPSAGPGLTSDVFRPGPNPEPPTSRFPSVPKRLPRRVAYPSPCRRARTPTRTHTHTRRFEKNDILRIVRALAIVRPSFIALQMPMTEEDDVFVEKCFQRSLIELDKLVSFSGTPTVAWRRTGEICLVGPEFCMLTGWEREELVGKRKYIYEVRDSPVL